MFTFKRGSKSDIPPQPPLNKDRMHAVVALAKKKAHPPPPPPQPVSVVTDVRNVAFGTSHKGSFIWDEMPEFRACKSCKKCRCCYCDLCKGRLAVLRGGRMKIPSKISLIEFFNKQLEDLIIQPDYPAVRYGEDEEDALTYRDLDLISNALANLLKSRIEARLIKNYNTDGDMVIAFCCRANIRYILLVFAILKLGATFFPISMEHPSEKIFQSILSVRPLLTIVTKELQIMEIMNEDRFKEYMIIYLEDIWDEMEQTDVPLNTHRVEFLKNSSEMSSKENLKSRKRKCSFKAALGLEKNHLPLFDRCVAIISPSNSNGWFTGIRYKSHSIFNWICWEWKHFKMSPGEQVMLQSDYDTVASLAEIFSPLLRGNCLVLIDADDIKNPVRLLDKIKEYKIVRLSIWPTILHAILRVVQLIGLEEGRRFLETVKYWFCIGGAMSSDLGELFFSLLPPGHRLLINMYGNDEDMGAVSYQIIDSAEHSNKLSYHSKMPIGSPLPNVKIYVVDENMKLVRGAAIGEICVAGEMLADNYSTSAGHTPDKMIQNPFSKDQAYVHLLKTGDYGRVITGDFGERYLFHEESRNLDRHANIHSRLVELDEIQLHLIASGVMKDCYVLCYRSGHEDQMIIAFCCCKESEFPKAVEYLLKQVPSYMVPDMVEVEELPRLDNGTINHNRLLRYHYDVMFKRKQFDDWEILGKLSAEMLHAVKVLFSEIFTMIGVPLKDLAQKFRTTRFKDLPRATYAKSIFVVYEIHRSGFPISLGEFMNAKTLEEIAANMLNSKLTRGQYFLDDSSVTSDWRYRIETMTSSHKDEVLDLLARTLTQSGSLDYFCETRRSDIKQFIRNMWMYFSQKKLSKILKRFSDGKIIGVIINVNWHDEVAPKAIKMSLELSYRFQLMNLLEEGFPETKLSQVTSSAIQVVYASIDDRHLNQLETYSLMERMIGETVKLAEELEFDVVVFTNYDFFVTDICVNNFGFEKVRECQLNQFVAANGRRPFFVAPDSLVATLCVRKSYSISRDHNYQYHYHF